MYVSVLKQKADKREDNHHLSYINLLLHMLVDRSMMPKRDLPASFNSRRIWCWTLLLAITASCNSVITCMIL